VLNPGFHRVRTHWIPGFMTLYFRAGALVSGSEPQLSVNDYCRRHP